MTKKTYKWFDERHARNTNTVLKVRFGRLGTNLFISKQDLERSNSNQIGFNLHGNKQRNETHLHMTPEFILIRRMLKDVKIRLEESYIFLS